MAKVADRDVLSGVLKDMKPKKFWDTVTKDKERLRAELAKLPFEKKVEITEQMQKDQWHQHGN